MSRARRIRDGEPYRHAGRPFWYGDHFDLESQRWVCRSTGIVIKERTLARDQTQQWYRDGVAAERGVQAPDAAKRQRALLEHVKDYMRTKEIGPEAVDDRHYVATRNRIHAIVAKAGWTALRHIDDDEIMEAIELVQADWVADQQARLDARVGRLQARSDKAWKRACKAARKAGETAPDKPAAPETPARAGGRGRTVGFTNATKNHYLTAFKGFTKWLAKRGRLDRDPLAFVRKWPIDGNESFRRRAFLVEEVAMLLDHTRDAAPLEGISGRDRAMLYLVAVCTGFRANELSSLTPRSFRLEEDPPAVVLGAAFSKSGKPYTQPMVHVKLGRLLSFAVRQVREWLVGKPATRELWQVPHNAARMIRRDLEGAGVTIEVGPDCVADFHALRGTLCRWLCDHGVMPDQAMVVMRHADVSTTMKHYTQVTLRDIAWREGAADQDEIVKAVRVSLEEIAARLRRRGFHQRADFLVPGPTGEVPATEGAYPIRSDSLQHHETSGNVMKQTDPLGASGREVSVGAGDPMESGSQRREADGIGMYGAFTGHASSRTRTLNPLIKSAGPADSKSADGQQVAHHDAHGRSQIVAIGSAEGERDGADPETLAEQARLLEGARMRRAAGDIQMAGAMDELSLEDAMRAVEDAEEDAAEAAGPGPCTNDAADAGTVHKPAPAEGGAA